MSTKGRVRPSAGQERDPVCRPAHLSYRLGGAKIILCCCPCVGGSHQGATRIRYLQPANRQRVRVFSLYTRPKETVFA
jgi:hypothetical protein